MRAKLKPSLCVVTALVYTPYSPHVQSHDILITMAVIKAKASAEELGNAALLCGGGGVSRSITEVSSEDVLLFHAVHKGVLPSNGTKALAQHNTPRVCVCVCVSVPPWYS